MVVLVCYIDSRNFSLYFHGCSHLAVHHGSLYCLFKEEERTRKNKETQMKNRPKKTKKRNGLHEHSETKSCCIEKADEPGTGNED